MDKRMKVSVITVAYNSQRTIRDTIDSVVQQTYSSIEYIVIDGASTDETANIVRSYGNKISVFISEPDKGLYDAINKGIRCATGDIVGILNSDDFFASAQIIDTIVKTFYNNENVDAVFADVAYVKANKTDKVVRLYSSKKFDISRFSRGYMPAHPSLYAKRELYTHFGLYKADYKIAADFEMMIRLFYTNKIKYVYVPMIFVFMRMGGISNKNISSVYLLNKETLRACRENKIQTSIAKLTLKYFTKIFEYILPENRIKQKSVKSANK